MQKHVNLVDLVESFPTSIYMQKSASIQPITSLSKFGGKFNSLFIRLLIHLVEQRDSRTAIEVGRPGDPELVGVLPVADEGQLGHVRPRAAIRAPRRPRQDLRPRERVAGRGWQGAVACTVKRH